MPIQPGRIAFLCLFVMLSPVLLRAQGNACHESPTTYEQEGYKVNAIRLDTPLNWLFGSVSVESRKLLESPDMPLKKGDPYTTSAANAGFALLRENLNELHAVLPFRFAFRFGRQHLQNCSAKDKTLDVVYRIYSFAPAGYLSQTPELGRQQEGRRSALQTNATQLASDYLAQPQIGYNSSRGLFGGTRLTVRQPGGLLNRVSIESTASSSSAVVRADATGERDFTRSWLQHAQWHLAYAHTDIPSEGLKLRQGALVGQFTAATRAYGKNGELMFRFGASVEGGNKQTDLDPAQVSLTELARSSYGAVKGYAGAVINLPNHVIKASYGIQAGKAGTGFQVNYVKQVFDAATNSRWLLKDHHPLTLDAQFTAGRLHNHGRVPVAERFFGGNAEQNFLVGDDWVIRSNPLIRSFAQNRFVPQAGVGRLGGDRFFSANVTIAPTFWAYSLVPKEILAGEEFHKALELGLGVAQTSLQNRILGDTKEFQDIAGIVLKMAPLAPKLKTELKSLASPNPNPEIDALLRRLFNPAPTPEAQPSGAFDRVEILTERIARSLDPQADEAPATRDLRSLVLGDDSDPDDPMPSMIEELSALLVKLETALNDATGVRIRALREKLVAEGEQVKTKFKVLEQSPSNANAKTQAEKEMAYAKRVLHQFLHEANLVAVSPVFLFDAARIGRDSFRGNDTSYALGTGVKFSLVVLDVTVAYAWNMSRRANEGRGALFFSMNVSNLFR